MDIEVITIQDRYDFKLSSITFSFLKDLYIRLGIYELIFCSYFVSHFCFDFLKQFWTLSSPCKCCHVSETNIVEFV